MKILILSHIYPSLDDINSNRDSMFLHMYVKQWNDMGHEIRVEHMALNYPRIFNYLCHKIEKLEKYKIPWCNYKQKEYRRDGIVVNRIPLMKLVPHGKYLKIFLNHTCKKILNDLRISKFEPNIIICDYVNPGLMVLNRINTFYSVKTYAIVHTADAYFLDKYIKVLKNEKISELSGIGFRSKALEKHFKEKLYLPRSFFIPSGIPKQYLELKRIPRTNIKEILIVSSFIERKHVDCVISAVHELNKRSGKYFLKIVGEGNLKVELEELVRKLNAEDWCKFKGKMERKDVLKQMNKADVFVLLSEGETFGMVYVEAMSQGCITIGSMGEGIDGIIKDGINGFLLSAGDEKGLIRLLQEMEKWDSSKLTEISKAAMNTAEAITDEILAAKVLDTIS